MPVTTAAAPTPTVKPRLRGLLHLIAFCVSLVAIALPYVVVGWIAVAAIPQMAAAVGGVGLALLVGGGLAYTVGAAVYALRRNNPWPALFGYHEVFHGLTIVAGAAHYLLIARYVLPIA